MLRSRGLARRWANVPSVACGQVYCPSGGDYTGGRGAGQCEPTEREGNRHSLLLSRVVNFKPTQLPKQRRSGDPEGEKV